jgi:hypothetical protein
VIEEIAGEGHLTRLREHADCCVVEACGSHLNRGRISGVAAETHLKLRGILPKLVIRGPVRPKILHPDKGPANDHHETENERGELERYPVAKAPEHHASPGT